MIRPFSRSPPPTPLSCHCSFHQSSHHPTDQPTTLTKIRPSSNFPVSLSTLHPDFLHPLLFSVTTIRRKGQPCYCSYTHRSSHQASHCNSIQQPHSPKSAKASDTPGWCEYPPPSSCHLTESPQGTPLRSRKQSIVISLKI